LKKEEFEIFELILPIISSLKREIPTIIIFYDQSGILPISANDLLENVWINYPKLEAFVNLSPREFYQALHSLCTAMINGEAPLNIDNAWMRFPLFIQMANVYFNNGNYYNAAQALRKVALIAQIYNKDEYLIASEQAAYLYSKINLYLEASKVLEEIDKRKSLDFKMLYLEAMIREGNLYFNQLDYQSAAEKYENAGQWASIELLDEKLMNEAFQLAATSWISAGQFQRAFQILDIFSREKRIIILNQISERIGATIDYLIRNDKHIQAREQLNIAISYYKKEELASLLTKFRPMIKRN
jgi:tetratricopeptide (TPR) repeat protein